MKSTMKVAVTGALLAVMVLGATLFGMGLQSVISDGSPATRDSLSGPVSVGTLMSTPTVSSTGVMLMADDSANDATKKEISRLTVDLSRVVDLVGEVNGRSIARAIEQVRELEKTPGNIYLAIDSPGGSVFAGAKLVTVIESAKQPVITVCVGMCASMGAVIFSYGKQRLMVDRSVLMFHGASGGAQGDISKVLSLLKFVNKFTEKADAYIAARANMDYKTFMVRVEKEIWIDGEDAVKEGFADRLVSLHTVGEPVSSTLLPESSDEEEESITSPGITGPGTVNEERLNAFKQ